MQINEIPTEQLTLIIDQHGIGVFKSGNEKYQFLGFLDQEEYIKSLQRGKLETPLLPYGTIAYKRDGVYEWFTICLNPAVYNLKHITSDHDDRYVERTHTISLPYLIFNICVRQISGKYYHHDSCLFVTLQKPDSPDVQLYQAPLGNVAGYDGHICYGEVSVDVDTIKNAKDLAEALIDSFLNGTSNDDYHVPGNPSAIEKIPQYSMATESYLIMEYLERMTKENVLWWADNKKIFLKSETKFSDVMRGFS